MQRGCKTEGGTGKGESKAPQMTGKCGEREGQGNVERGMKSDGRRRREGWRSGVKDRQGGKIQKGTETRGMDDEQGTQGSNKKPSGFLHDGPLINVKNNMNTGIYLPRINRSADNNPAH